MALRHRESFRTNHNAREKEIFEDKAMFVEKHLSDHPTGSADKYAIVVRSLNTVGGTRPGKRNTRRLNHVARGKGYRDWAAFMHAIRLNRDLFTSIQNIAANIEQRQEAVAP